MYESSITVDQVIDALVAFITPFAVGAPIIRAQVNQAPFPAPACIVLTELLQVDLDVPFAEYSPDDGTAAIQGPSRIDVQADFYGPNAGEMCQAVRSSFRSAYAFDKFPPTVKPLYTSDGIQAPLITGEQQYASRWTTTLSLEYRPAITVPQQFADSANATLIEV